MRSNIYDVNIATSGLMGHIDYPLGPWILLEEKDWE